jgi:CopG family nickel-responsive transcriptional regulator
MHAHLDHEECIETVLLKGTVKRVREFAQLLMAERGVRHGSLNIISVELGREHRHGGSTHRHLKPQI